MRTGTVQAVSDQVQNDINVKSVFPIQNHNLRAALLTAKLKIPGLQEKMITNGNTDQKFALVCAED